MSLVGKCTFSGLESYYAVKEWRIPDGENCSR